MKVEGGVKNTHDASLLAGSSQLRQTMYCRIPTRGHIEKGKTRESKRTSGFQELGCREGRTGGAKRIFRAVELLCMIL